MPTALEVLEPLRKGLVPVPATQPGVCSTCHSSCAYNFDCCFPCNEAVQRVNAHEVIPVSLSVARGLLHRHLRGYKDDPRPDVRDRMTLRLAGLLAVFVANHRACIGDYDTIALVPSKSRVAMEAVINRIPSLADAFVPTLSVNLGYETRDLDPDRFNMLRSVAGEHVLLIDDTFTTGASVFSAGAQLKEHGATVTTVVLGRHVNPEYGPSRELLAWLEYREWADRHCVRCGGEFEDPYQLRW